MKKKHDRVLFFHIPVFFYADTAGRDADEFFIFFPGSLIFFLTLISKIFLPVFRLQIPGVPPDRFLPDAGAFSLSGKWRENFEKI